MQNFIKSPKMPGVGSKHAPVTCMAALFLIIATGCATTPTVTRGDATRDNVETQVWMEFTQTAAIENMTAAYEQARREAMVTLSAPPPTPLGGGRGQIAFVSSRDGNSEIYIMNVDGANARRLTDNPAADIYPSWSPDGRRIAFVAHRDNNAEIYVVNVEDSSITNLTNDPAEDYMPSWSPDGSQIAFVSNRDVGNLAIYIMNADGTNVRRLSDNLKNYAAPKWSPDSTQIAFLMLNDEQIEGTIYVMNTDGSNSHRLFDSDLRAADISWSPGAERLAFSTPFTQDEQLVNVARLFLMQHNLPDVIEPNNGGNQGIYIVNTDGSNIHKLPNTFGALEPHWSPDGTEIVYTSLQASGLEIYTMHADGDNVHRLTNNEALDTSPTWRP